MGKIIIDVRPGYLTAQGPVQIVPLLKICELWHAYRRKVGKDLLPGKFFVRRLLLHVEKQFVRQRHAVHRARYL